MNKGMKRRLSTHVQIEQCGQNVAYVKGNRGNKADNVAGMWKIFFL